jgi:hypothetical protein
MGMSPTHAWGFTYHYQNQTTKVESSNPVFPFVQQKVNPQKKKKKMIMKK